MNEAKTQGENWAPIKAGFFKGSYERFHEISTDYEKLINKIGWF
jgi:hypothetical protein